jgi:hypothetical protein
MLHRRKVKTAGRMVVPSDRTVTAVESEVHCVFALSYSRSHVATKSRCLPALRRRRRLGHVLELTVVARGINWACITYFSSRQYRCYSFSSGLTLWIFYCWRSWVFPPDLSLLCWSSEIVCHYLITCHRGFEELFYFSFLSFFLLLTVEDAKDSLEKSSDILVPSVNSLSYSSSSWWILLLRSGGHRWRSI